VVEKSVRGQKCLFLLAQSIKFKEIVKVAVLMTDLHSTLKETYLLNCARQK